MKRVAFLALGLVILSLSSRAQFIAGVRPLTIGDTLPDLVLHHVYGYGHDSIRTADLRGRVVVLDFFATTCGSCLQLLPHLDSLQDYFGEKALFLVVDRESYTRIKTQLSRLKWMPPLPHLSFVTNDEMLSTLFPYNTIPHEIVIDANGRIQAITHAYRITRPVISSVIAGATLHFPVKKDQIDYSISEPLFYYGNGGDISQVYLQSTFCHYIDGLPLGMNTMNKAYDSILNDSIHARILLTNKSIPYLYRVAAYPRGNRRFDRMVLEVRDSSRYFRPKNTPRDEWNPENTYCYELIAPAHTPRATLRRYMMEDLNRALHINGRLEKRAEDCWVLVSTSGSGSRYKAHPDGNGTSGKPATFSHMTMAEIAGQLSGTNTYVFDETHYSGSVDINLPADLHDLPAVRKALHAYGLDLVPSKRMMTMLVLTEDDYPNGPGKMADTTGGHPRSGGYMK